VPGAALGFFLPHFVCHGLRSFLQAWRPRAHALSNSTTRPQSFALKQSVSRAAGLRLLICVKTSLFGMGNSVPGHAVCSGSSIAQKTSEAGSSKMHNPGHEHYWYEMDPSAAEEPLVDVGNRDSVLDFINRYLESSSRPKSIDEVHDVAAAISRYKGPRLVRSATLESFLARHL